MGKVDVLPLAPQLRPFLYCINVQFAIELNLMLSGFWQWKSIKFNPCVFWGEGKYLSVLRTQSWLCDQGSLLAVLREKICGLLYTVPCASNQYQLHARQAPDLLYYLASLCTFDSIYITIVH